MTARVAGTLAISTLAAALAAAGTRAREEGVTFNAHVAPILFRH